MLEEIPICCISSTLKMRWIRSAFNRERIEASDGEQISAQMGRKSHRGASVEWGLRCEWCATHI